jgi:3-dehydroquinate dehydratase-2
VRMPKSAIPPLKPVYILNGPNLNLLGSREPDIYGRETLPALEIRCRERAKELGFTITFKQSNIEGEIVNWIQEARQEGSGIIINAAAYTHTSVAIHDALKSADLPIVEVHLSNPYKREQFRHQSFVSPLAHGMICGFGGLGYEFALSAMRHIIDSQKKT